MLSSVLYYFFIFITCLQDDYRSFRLLLMISGKIFMNTLATIFTIIIINFCMFTYIKAWYDLAGMGNNNNMEISLTTIIQLTWHHIKIQCCGSKIHWIWIRIQIRDFGPIWIQIQCYAVNLKRKIGNNFREKKFSLRKYIFYKLQKKNKMSPKKFVIQLVS